MKDKKGQALIEFILILPILLMILVAIIDFGNIMYKKYQLENDLNLIVDFYEQGKVSQINQYIKEQNLSIRYEEKEEWLNIILSRKVSIMTPGLSNLLNNPYILKVNRMVYHE